MVGGWQTTRVSLCFQQKEKLKIVQEQLMNKVVAKTEDTRSLEARSLLGALEGWGWGCFHLRSSAGTLNVAWERDGHEGPRAGMGKPLVYGLYKTYKIIWSDPAKAPAGRTQTSVHL